MKIGWLQDFTWEQRPGGAQRAVALFAAAKPADVDIVLCPPGAVDRDCDVYVSFLIKYYSFEELEFLSGVKHHLRCGFDWWHTGEPNYEWRSVLNEKASVAVYVSPLHLEVFNQRYGCKPVNPVVLPPPLDVERYETAYKDYIGVKSNAVWAAEWHPYKGPDLAASWALRNRTHLDLYGFGGPAQGSTFINRFSHPKQSVPDSEWPETLVKYEYGIHYNRFPDAFSYFILESYLMGLKTVVSGLTGIESFKVPFNEMVDMCSRSAEDFWRLVSQA